MNEKKINLFYAGGMFAMTIAFILWAVYAYIRNDILIFIPIMFLAWLSMVLFNRLVFLKLVVD